MLVDRCEGERKGEAVESGTVMCAFAREARRRGLFPIVHGVWGGITGMSDYTTSALLTWEKHSNNDAGGYVGMGVIDVCQ